MSKRTQMIVCAVLLCGVLAVGLHADSMSEQKKAQNKLLALRAARLDAMRKIAERINGLFITSETKVQDFVAESDEIKTVMGAWLSGMREVGKPVYNDDGTCEVTMEVTLKEVVITLKQMRDRYYKGTKFKGVDFEQITQHNNFKVIRETGSGAPREEADDTMTPVKEDTSLDSTSYLSGAAKKYWYAHVKPQGRLMAVRAARVDAMRRLAERIKGVFIASETRVEDFVAESDKIQSAMVAFLRGARETGIDYHADELIVEVEMQVKLRTVITNIKSYTEAHYKGDKVKLKKLQEISQRYQDKIITEIGMGVPPEKYLKDVQLTVTEQMIASNTMPDWIGRTLRATGNAAIDTDNPNKAQAKLMAYRAAELDARRKLAEEIRGLMITSNTSVKDFVAENDEIQTAMLDFQQGARVVDGSQKIAEDGTAEVTVEIELSPLWDTVVLYQKKLSINIK